MELRFMTQSANDIVWMRNPENYPTVAETIQTMKDGNVWDNFLQAYAESQNCSLIDVDELFDFIRHESDAALQMVGLHENQGTATISEVLKAWEAENAAEGWRICRLEDSSVVSLQLYNYGGTTGICLEFDATNPDNAIEEISLGPDEVLDLVGQNAHGNATIGAWDSIDIESATFEMWRERD